jgi:hypothetical protein
MNWEVRIVKELWAHFSYVRVPKGLLGLGGPRDRFAERRALLEQ